MKTEAEIMALIAAEGEAHQCRLARLRDLRERLENNVGGAKASLSLALSRYADSDTDDIENVLTMAARAMAAAEAAKLIPTLIETIERQYDSKNLALQREAQVANTATDELAHRRALVEREQAEHGDVSMDTLGRYLRFAATSFGEGGLNEAMTAMTALGLEARAANCVAYLRSLRQIPESTSWAA